MKSLKNTTWILCLLVLFAACRKDEKLNLQQPVGLGGDTTASTAIDKWLRDSLTTPYNIDVKYRWDPSNASLYKTVTPADESRVIPLFSALKRTWINPYNDETGSELFMKKYTPKQFVLIGSVEYDYYSVTLGQAEGGNNIVLFDVNQNFDKSAIVSLRRAIHTAHHEFGHILHQTVLYPLDFVGTSGKLGLANYTATWFNISDADALQQGYVTSYAMSGKDDDFVETIAVMLTEGRQKFQEMKAAANATARQALQQKEDYVVSYYKQVWNIDFYSLQTRVQAALNALFPSLLTDYFGFGKTYTRISINPANTTLLTQQTGFTIPYNSSKTALLALNATSKFTLDSVAMVATAATANTLRLYFHSATNVNYLADFNYNFTRNAAGIYTFTYAGVPGTTPGANGTFIKASVQPLLDYFSNNTFKIDWYINPNNTNTALRVVLTPQTTANAASMGLLLF
ncbi:MAG: hypothetical protein INR73_16130 [Williamsia sp.]|nr:hypothetical protein [Williamsia sp.]